MKHFVYKITNINTDKFYIGVHSCDEFCRMIRNGVCTYMGSGKHIKRAVNKHGIENFTKEILFEYETEISAYNKEGEIVNEDFVARKDTYNVALGGVVPTCAMRGKKHSAETRRKQSASRKGQHAGDKNPNYGKPITDEVKLKISKANLGKTVGAKNGNYGKMWITNGYTNKMIMKTDAIPLGWKRGKYFSEETKEKLRLAKNQLTFLSDWL